MSFKDDDSSYSRIFRKTGVLSAASLNALIREVNESMAAQKDAPKQTCIIGEYCHTHGFVHSAVVMNHYFTLAADGRTLVPEPDAKKWQRWMAHSTLRVLKQETLPDGGFVSTVFTGVSLQNEITLWQTLVLAPEQEPVETFYNTYDHAMAGHDAYVAALRGGRVIVMRDE